MLLLLLLIPMLRFTWQVFKGEHRSGLTRGGGKNAGLENEGPNS